MTIPMQSIPMRKASRKIQNEAEVDDLLDRAAVGRLGTCYENEPYITPVNFVYWHGRLYFHAALVGKKTRNLKAHPLVCFEVDEYGGIDPAEKACDFGARYASVIVYGHARLVQDATLKRDAMTALMDKYAAPHPYVPFDDKDLATISLWELEISEKAGKRRPNPGNDQGA